ncbi:AbrB/MazE/SpoVT family DNA-binding domain-containing protein [Halalkalirubrum salinum]|uniref:AbrB/MazE/SpoVT family DNA-binding domain-containing protein n=1 Tax=Halalkalirubrum salinum TaxID=2563889 RepID=UPI0010FBB16F|nr:AbrB/MazE/SpoVT family DNA-binding domain-containing protein [Halalkalirubrum salinum]
MKRRISDSGRITLPKQLREELDISCGDDVEIYTKSGKIIVEPPITQADLAAGYHERADRIRKFHDTMDGVSKEADACLGDIPDWE